MNTVTISVDEYNHLRQVKNIDIELTEIRGMVTDILRTIQAEARRVEPSDAKRIYDEYEQRRKAQRDALTANSTPTT